MWYVTTTIRAPPGREVHGPADAALCRSPGTFQLARSPRSETWNAPSTTVVTRPPRAMPWAATLSKKLAPGSMLTSCPLAL